MIVCFALQLNDLNKKLSIYLSIYLYSKTINNIFYYYKIILGVI